MVGLGRRCGQMVFGVEERGVVVGGWSWLELRRGEGGELGGGGAGGWLPGSALGDLCHGGLSVL